MIPSRSQWKKWSLASKHSSLGLLAGVLSLFLGGLYWYSTQSSSVVIVNQDDNRSYNFDTDIELALTRLQSLTQHSTVEQSSLAIEKSRGEIVKLIQIVRSKKDALTEEQRFRFQSIIRIVIENPQTTVSETTTGDDSMAETAEYSNVGASVSSEPEYATNGSLKPLNMSAFDPVVAPVVVPVLVPACESFSASPALITSGQASTLAWVTRNATSVAISQFVGTVKPSGSRTVIPTVTTIYTLLAVGTKNQTANCAVLVKVTPRY